MPLKEKVEELKDYLSKYEKLVQAMNLVYWDMRTNMPIKAGESRSKVLEYLSGESFNTITSPKVEEFIKDLSQYKNEMNHTEVRMLEELERNYNETKKIPQDRYVAYVGICSNSELAWEKAKDVNNFEIFKPHLEKVVEFQKEFINYWGFKHDKYDTLLDKYELGLTTEKLDKIFAELRDGIIEVLNSIKASNKKINRDFLYGKFDTNKQKDLSLYILNKLGFDLKAGRLDESVHPFTTNFGNRDVRLTTNYHEDEFASALFSTIHEGGHGIYEQNISDDLESTGLQSGASMAIHESQSRFYENILGRSKEFCSYLLPIAKEYFEDFKNVTLDEFYEAMNYVEPSLIRTEADELTYGLHIIIRYEIEKELINGRIGVDDLKELWNKKYKEYLGIEPKNDSEGILQDMHWSDGSFGYFPSYALGNLYGAQMFHKLLEENPNIMEEVKNGNFTEIFNWLKEKVHVHGSLYTPEELIKNITGEELNSKYFIDYLKNKYYRIYDVR
ncbi:MULTISPECIES: carboxypeptidase M32 [unclassified Clostridium]|uniref:carboxypeptidase M32 n=1 Tax=unclassified Clostridium TaxID=2614128 RepID=UPI0018999FEA|nr:MULTISPECIES: carboxypeptidase M32 [unclassified Clostridium]MCR1952676.1 carboxypeptidase M32 [Clostridium sp. DSM 100503]